MSRSSLLEANAAVIPGSTAWLSGIFFPGVTTGAISTRRSASSCTCWFCPRERERAACPGAMGPLPQPLTQAGSLLVAQHVSLSLAKRPRVGLPPAHDNPLTRQRFPIDAGSAGVQACRTPPPPPAPNSESCLGAPHDHTGCPWTLQARWTFLATALFLPDGSRLTTASCDVIRLLLLPPLLMSRVACRSTYTMPWPRRPGLWGADTGHGFSGVRAEKRSPWSHAGVSLAHWGVILSSSKAKPQGA